MYMSRVRVHPSLKTTQLAKVLQDRQGYGLHRLFWDLFSDGCGGKEKRPFLFREEVAGEQLDKPGRRRLDPLFYVLSQILPDTDSPLFEIQSKPYRPQLSEGEKLAFKLRVNAVVRRDGKRHDIVMHSQRNRLCQQLGQLDLSAVGQKRELKARLLDHAHDALLENWRSQIGNGVFVEKLQQRLSRSETLEWAIKTAVDQAVQDWWQKRGEKLGFAIVRDQYDRPKLEAVGYQKHFLPEKSLKAGFNSLDLSGEVIVENVEAFRRLLFDGIGPAKAFGCGLMLVRRV